MKQNISKLLTENYASYIKDNSTLFEEAITSAEVIVDDAYYEMYIDKLTEGIEESVVKTIRPLLDRERAMYLEESSSILAEPQAIAYAVASFPMLINIYAEPLLSKVVTIYPSDKPTMSIPRLLWQAKVIDIDGSYTTVDFPTARQLVRPDYKTVDLVTSNSNLFTLLGTTYGVTFDKSDFRISRRNFRVAKIVGTTSGDTPVSIVADARGNFSGTFVATGTTDTYKLQGQISFDSGAVTWSVATISAATPDVFTSLDVKIRVFGNGNGRGVVKSYPKQSMIDVNADVEDSFEVENLEEIIQDWKALYDVNILAELKNHVKDQIKLNRDIEIADLMESNIEFAKTFGHYMEVDLSTFIGSSEVRPASIQDIFKNLIPSLMSLVEIMRRTNNMDVEYIVCGINASVILKSMQEFAIKMDGMTGQSGMSGTTGAFAKLEIVSSYAVSEDLIHLVTGASSLAQSSLVEVLYKPLYIIIETTNSIRRTFIKSRTWIGVVRPEGIGTIRLQNYAKYFGTYITA